MPVVKYRDVSQMPPPPPPTEDELADRIRAVMARAARLSGSGYPAGVFRFRSLEEADEARQKATRERIRRLRQSNPR